LELWWRLGWLPVLMLPFAWYLVMLWYGGCWERRPSPLWRRQRIPFGIIAVLFAGLIGLLLAHSVPPIVLIAGAEPQVSLSGTTTRILMLVFPVYTIACIGCSIDALRRPNPSRRVMGEAARRRARPWLVGTSVSLLSAGLLVGGVLVWVIMVWSGSRWGLGWPLLDRVFAWADLAIAGCIALSVVLLGQAVTRYEIFTGKTLPQHGLAVLWQRVLILAVGYSLVVSGSLAIQLHPIYTLLLSTLLLAGFFAMLGWRQYIERERWMQQLRPILASQQLYDRALGTEEESPGLPRGFVVLCQDVLSVQNAALFPLGALGPLVASPLVYPESELPEETKAWISAHPEPFAGEGKAGAPLDPGLSGGYIWCIPLWRQSGLSGRLFLGEKRDGGLYTQEEIAVAQAAGEQILDTLASAELARRLIRLQRQQMTESQVFDRRLRRALHDDILPQVHEAILAVDRLETPNPGERQTVVDGLSDLHHQISHLLRGLKSQAGPDFSRVGLFQALQEMIEGEMPGSFEQVDWEVQPIAEETLRRLSPTALEVLFYAAREAIRNAAAHAEQVDGKAPCLRIEILGEGGLEIRVQDSGGKWSGRSSGQPPGSGNGLVLHSTMMSILGGTLQIESTETQPTRVRLCLPREAIRQLSGDVGLA
jgi:signal transduction histidine kinase